MAMLHLSWAAIPGGVAFLCVRVTSVPVRAVYWRSINRGMNLFGIMMLIGMLLAWLLNLPLQMVFIFVDICLIVFATFWGAGALEVWRLSD